LLACLDSALLQLVTAITMTDISTTTAAAIATPNCNGNNSHVVKKKKPCLSAQSTALEICSGFFQAMDLDRNGFIEEGEMRIIATVAFDETEDEAQSRWQKMLTDMDTNGDCMISQEEYITWWLENTKDKIVDNTCFKESYATYLLQSLPRIASVKTAHNLCDAFFDAMDANGDGFLVEDEIMNISKWAFGAKDNTAQDTWVIMRDQMDTNKDGKISREEYSTYWMAQCKGKIQPESGKFVPEYQKYLLGKLGKLGKLRAGKKRQEQLKVWEKDCADDAADNKRKQEGESNTNCKKEKRSPKKSRRISFSNPPDEPSAVENGTKKENE